MLNWRRDKASDEDKTETAQKATAGGSRGAGSERASRSTAEAEGKENAAAATGPDNRRMLGEMLVSEGIIAQAQLDEALAKKEKTGGFLGQVLVELDYVKQNDLISFLVKQCKIPHISLADYQICEQLLSLVPEEVCLQHGLLPIDKLGKILTVAMVDPLDADALEAVREACPELRIKPILCDWNHFAPACDRLFKKGKGGASALTASSFGLSEKASEPSKAEGETEKAEESKDAAAGKDAAASDAKPILNAETAESEKPAAKAAPAPAAPQAAPAQPAPATSAAPSICAEDIAAGIRDSMRDTLREVVATLAKSQPAQAAPAPDYEMLAKLMRESVEQGMAKSTGSLIAAVQASTAQSAAATAQHGEDNRLSAAQIADTVQQNLGEAMQTAIGELAKSLQGNSGQAEAPAGPSAEDVAKAMGQSMQEALGAMAQQFSAVLEAESRRSEDTQKTLAALQKAFESAATPAESHTAQIIEIAEAARRAAETAEKAIEAFKEAQTPLSEPEEHDNVHEFPGGMPRKSADADVAALDALDSPGLAAHTNEQIRAALENEQPIPGFGFGGFVGGKTNELTVTLCKALASGQTGELTPFYLYGGVGLGKSHLLNAIGNNIVARNSDLRIGYVSAGMMARKFAKALADDHAAEFRGRYCDVDMLLIDDVHLLAQKMVAQEEMLYILDAFLLEGRPLLLAGNAPPEKLSGLDPCLASRLFSAVVASVRAPEQAARAEILARLAQSAQANVPEEIIHLIATQIQDDMRKMTGALRKVIAYAHVSGQAIDKTIAGEVLSQLGVNAA